jgi:hypothetical protein
VAEVPWMTLSVHKVYPYADRVSALAVAKKKISLFTFDFDVLIIIFQSFFKVPSFQYG